MRLLEKPENVANYDSGKGFDGTLSILSAGSGWLTVTKDTNYQRMKAYEKMQ